MQSILSNPNSVLPALRYGMNLQLVNGQPQLPMEAPFRILTTCSWEQNAYTVKIYVPLHGVKTDLLRAVFEPHMLDIKAMNLQVKQLVWSFAVYICILLVDAAAAYKSLLVSLQIVSVSDNMLRCRAKITYSV